MKNEHGQMQKILKRTNGTIPVARRLETFYQYRRFQKELQKEAEIAVLDKEWNLTYNALRG